MSSSIHEELTREEARLKQLDDERTAVLKNIRTLQTQLAAATSKSPANQQTDALSPEAKISLFRSLFKGREDVYGTVRTVVWEDGGSNSASYPI